MINPLAALGALSMLLQVVGDRNADAAVRRAGDRVDEAIAATCPKLKSLSAGRMGYSTSEVGDLVCEAL